METQQSNIDSEEAIGLPFEISKCKACLALEMYESTA